MVSAITFLVIAVLIIAIWVIIEVKRMRHKIFAIFLIALILFGYFSFTFVLRDKNVDYSSFSGILKGTEIYFSWLGSIFGNAKTVTTNAIKMDWGGNKSSEK